MVSRFLILILTPCVSGFVKKHTFEQLQYVRWPENGTPPTPTIIICLIKNLYKVLETAKHDIKTLVHGSLGVGRTGTFIALFELMEMLDANLSCYNQLKNSSISIKDETMDTSSLDIFSSVLNLRKQRCEMVRKHSNNCKSNITKSYRY